MVPVDPVITGTSFVLTFHISCISILTRLCILYRLDKLFVFVHSYISLYTLHAQL
jgi:hypothetical protein